jgi:hypothetical protein
MDGRARPLRLLIDPIPDAWIVALAIVRRSLKLTIACVALQ